MQRLLAKFEGRVQGVGFRMTVAELASGFAVNGVVCNVADGSVELAAEGETAELQRFHEAILQRMARNIVHHTTDWQEAAAPKYHGFAIGRDKP